MQQGVQTDATCNIQQCWELLVSNVASVCTQPHRKLSKILMSLNSREGIPKVCCEEALKFDSLVVKNDLGYLASDWWIAAFACPTTSSPGRFSLALKVRPPPKPWKSALGTRLHARAERRTTVGMTPYALGRNAPHHVTRSQETVDTLTISTVLWSLNDIFWLVLHKPVG